MSTRSWTASSEGREWEPHINEVALALRFRAKEDILERPRGQYWHRMCQGMGRHEGHGEVNDARHGRRGKHDFGREEHGYKSPGSGRQDNPHFKPRRKGDCPDEAALIGPVIFELRTPHSDNKHETAMTPSGTRVSSKGRDMKKFNLGHFEGVESGAVVTKWTTLRRIPSFE